MADRVADRELLTLDDRRLLVELQSLGVRVEDETSGDGVPGRRGGAGPADAGFIWVRGLPLTVPMHAAYAQESPYTLRLTDHGSSEPKNTRSPPTPLFSISVSSQRAPNPIAHDVSV